MSSSRWPSTVVVLTSMLVGCHVDLGVDAERFVCSSPTDCVAGWHCDEVLGECVADSPPAVPDSAETVDAAEPDVPEEDIVDASEPVDISDTADTADIPDVEEPPIDTGPEDTTDTTDTADPGDDVEPPPDIEEDTDLPPPPEGEITIPSGDFWMGCNPDKLAAAGLDGCFSNEKPVHLVTLSSYTVDATEVRCDAFVEFLNSSKNMCGDHACWKDKAPKQIEAGPEDGTWQLVDAAKAELPVVWVTWYGAKAFCEAQGKSLCTEAQWEKAACGSADVVDGYAEGNTPLFPWGDAIPGCKHAVMKDCASGPEPVGQKPDGASPYGVLGLGGNVREFVLDSWSLEYPSTPQIDPVTPVGGTPSVVARGGTHAGAAHQLRCARRGQATIKSGGQPNAWPDTGFRCCRSL